MARASALLPTVVVCQRLGPIRRGPGAFACRSGWRPSPIFLWKQNIGLGLVLRIAMLGNMMIAGSVGAGVPLFLRRIGMDPAVSSAVVVTTVTGRVRLPAVSRDRECLNQPYTIGPSMILPLLQPSPTLTRTGDWTQPSFHDMGRGRVRSTVQLGQRRFHGRVRLGSGSEQSSGWDSGRPRRSSRR